MNTHRTPSRIVLAEDDRATARLLEIAIKRTGILHRLEVVSDGDEAIAALENGPNLLLLDLHIPGKDSFEILEYRSRRSSLRQIPVVMLSYSDLPSDVTRAYDLRANAYVRKTTDFTELCETMDATIRFWLQKAVTPF